MSWQSHHYVLAVTSAACAHGQKQTYPSLSLGCTLSPDQAGGDGPEEQRKDAKGGRKMTGLRTVHAEMSVLTSHDKELGALEDR